MNGRKAKALRRSVAHLPVVDAQRRYASYLDGKIVDKVLMFAGRPLTVVYPSGSRRRAYQDAKRG